MQDFLPTCGRVPELLTSLTKNGMSPIMLIMSFACSIHWALHHKSLNVEFWNGTTSALKTGFVPHGHALKKAIALNATIVFVDESGLLMQPLVRRTWAPKGKTPFIYHSARSYKKVLAIGALAAKPKISKTRFTPT